ncbi:MAG TPA: hypothetical protein VH877_24545 [Polyangia bacterium]|jgi:hypothetical protein|nr:hypothetical protein [Polyangia bacterium]
MQSYRGYWQSPWPGEDGGPERMQMPQGLPGLGLAQGERLAVTERRLTAATMIVLRDPGEVYLLRHTVYRSFVGLPTTSRVERIDPERLAPLERSPELPGGPFWPGGLAAHANGSLYVVYGCYCHRLGADCTLLASHRLPRPRPYNSFVILDDGVLVMKEIQREGRERSHLSVLDPERLAPLCAEVECPEPSVARLSAQGNTLYVIGTRSAFRYRWDPGRARLELDETWRPPYLTSPDQSYGWDAVIDGTNAWFMDNGAHTYKYHLRGEGVARGPVHLVRASLAAGGEWEMQVISGRPRGTITNPPLFAQERGIAVAYDASHAVLVAWRFDEGGAGGAGRWQPLWRKEGFACASHFVYFPDTGELVTNDFHRLLGDDVVVLDIETGREKARARVGSLYQSVLFPAPGWRRDVYYTSFSKIARVFAR